MPIRDRLKALFGGHKAHPPSTVDTRSPPLQSVSPPASDTSAKPTSSANDTPVVAIGANSAQAHPPASTPTDPPSLFKKFKNLTVAKVRSRPPPTPRDLSVRAASAEHQLQTPGDASAVGGDSVQVDPPRVDTPSALLPAASDPPVANSISGSGLVLDHIAITLGLVEKAAGLFHTVPFIAPVTALMSEILKAYKEMKNTNDKREALLAHITDITHDLCATVLRMEATKHVDVIGRLKADIETYIRLLKKASTFVGEYDQRGAFVRFVARNQLGGGFSELERELDFFGTRFRANRLVDLTINQNVTSGMRITYSVIGKIEKWLGPPPDMLKKQHDTQELHKEGTGRWLLDGAQFIEWQDNPGALWIRGPSGSGKIINKLIKDKQLSAELGKSSAVAFFYFDFKDKEGHTVERALRRVVLQLSAQSPSHYRALDKLYALSEGQTLPTYQDLEQVLQELLLELGRTYIVLDALDECPDLELDKLVDLISMLCGWNRSPLHLLIASQARAIFINRFTAIPSLSLDSDVTEPDIKLFVDSKLQSNQKMQAWASRMGTTLTDRIVRKSNGMFRLAACLLFELSRSRQHDLDETLANLPDDLNGIYDRFLQPIREKDLVPVAGVLRWLLFSAEPLTLAQLADAVALDFSDPPQCTYHPNRREDNADAILEWLEGLVTIRDDYRGSWIALAHASVQDYLLSEHFTHKYGFDLSAGPSHAFIGRSCIGYLLHFSDPPLDLNTYPLARYTTKYWCHHLSRSGVPTATKLECVQHGNNPVFDLIDTSRPWFNIHQSSAQPSHHVVTQIWEHVSRDVSTVLRELISVLRDSETRKSFFAYRGALAQQLLDLVQDLLDICDSNSRALLSKALVKLVHDSELHPTCFKLSNFKKVGEPVGHGTSGDRFKGLVGDQIVSVKIMRVFNDFEIKAMMKEFGREAVIWRQLSHPNVLPFFGLCYLEARPCLVSPWMENRDLVKFLQNASPETDRTSLILDIAMGLEYLHGEHTSNILVSASGRACIANFGLSSIISSIRFSQSGTRGATGAARWQAPELLSGELNVFDFRSDVYAFACVSYEILSGKVPLYEVRDASVTFKVVEGLRPTKPVPWRDDEAYNGIWKIMQECWKEEFNARPTAAKIVQRLVDPPIGAKPTKPGMDWDDTFISRLRSFSQGGLLYSLLNFARTETVEEHIVLKQPA
ncbi:Protein kinase domain-containing protein [Mycena venus]|uniref:Protein kinase domain-containing protein n=1 Tax=Mycena venus TaxID=2733690 RepID=A0A8H7CDB0_9AGAR|nr:Protein kinase domain-containing protein [Mycena venus]